MIQWENFERAAPEIAQAGARLLEAEEVAFLSTVSATGRPRLHPFVPRVIEGRLVAFIMDSSPKIQDLRNRKQYAIHTLPGAEDEEFCISGEAQCCDAEVEYRHRAAEAMDFATGVDEHHVLFEFRIDRGLWTRWLDFGTPEHRPQRVRWSV